MVEPYRSSPVFDEDTLPAALRKEHRTKPGVWGVVRMIEGEMALRFGDDTEDQTLAPGRPGLLLPDQPHWVTPLGKMRMQVDFYDRPPDLAVEQAARAVS